MKPVIFSIVATLCYAFCNVLIERYLVKYNNLTIVICYTAVILFLTLFARQIIKTTDDPSFDFPTGDAAWIILGVGLLYTVADYCYIGAYTGGGSLITITSIISMFPIFASLIKFLFTKDLPNIWQLSGYAVAVIAILLVAKGSTVEA